MLPKAAPTETLYLFPKSYQRNINIFKLLLFIATNNGHDSLLIGLFSLTKSPPCAISGAYRHILK